MIEKAGKLIKQGKIVIFPTETVYGIGTNGLDENAVKRLYEIKTYLLKGKKLEFFMSKYRLPQFVCEKLMNQASKFSLKQLNQLIKVCVNTEIKLKSSTTDKQMEMELMLFKTFMIK